MMTLTAYGQLSTDSVTITREQQKQCIKWYFESLYKDSIIISKDSIISISSNRISKLESDLIRSLDVQDTQAQSIKDLRKRKNRAWIIGSVGGLVAGILSVVLIM